MNIADHSLVYHDAALTEYVTRLGDAVIPQDANPQRVTWRFRVLRDPLPNVARLLR
jgi:hypothetical protein